MSTLRKLRKNLAAKKPKKMAEIIATYAADFLADCTGQEQRQNYLNCACTAWNLALLPESELEERLDQMVAEYERINPGVTDSDYYRKNLIQLLARKVALYPEVRRAVVEATISDGKGKDTITVVSAPVGQ